MGMLTAVSNYILGPFGIAMIVCGVAGSFIAAAIHVLPPRAGFISMWCGGAAFVGAYIVRTYVTMGA